MNEQIHSNGDGGKHTGNSPHSLSINGSFSANGDASSKGWIHRSEGTIEDSRRVWSGGKMLPDITACEILIVDDQQTNLDLLSTLLRSLDFRNVQTEADAVSAFERIMNEEPDLVILDLNMPVLSGQEILRRIRSHPGHVRTTPVLVCTADASSEVKRTVLSLGADDYVLKPYDVIELYFRARSLLVARELRKQLEVHNAELERANARLQDLDKFKSELVATASHEIRTPVAIIRENASQLVDGLGGPVSPEQVEMLEVILRNSDRLTSLIAKLLEMRKIEEGATGIQRRETDLRPMLSECESDFSATCKSKNIELRFIVEENLPTVLCDKMQIQQVLVNLITNAVKFTPESGSITVSVKAEGEHVRISVADTGRGIPEKDLEYIFEAFGQVDRGVGPGSYGTGLGLRISQSIVELHDNKIEVESEIGKGSTFSFKLPAWDERLLLPAFVSDHLNGCPIRNCPAAIMLLEVVVARSVDPSADLQLLHDLATSVLNSIRPPLRLESTCSLAFALQLDESSTALAVHRLYSELAKHPRLEVDVATIQVSPTQSVQSQVEQLITRLMPIQQYCRRHASPQVE